MTNTQTETVPFSDTERKFEAMLADHRCWADNLHHSVPDSIYDTLDQYSNEVLARYMWYREQGLPSFEFEPPGWSKLVRHLADKNPTAFPRLDITMGHDDEHRPGPHIEDSVIVCQILAKMAGEEPEPAHTNDVSQPSLSNKEYPHLLEDQLMILFEIALTEEPKHIDKLTTSGLYLKFMHKRSKGLRFSDHGVQAIVEELKQMGLIYRDKNLKNRWQPTTWGKEVAKHKEGFDSFSKATQ